MKCDLYKSLILTYYAGAFLTWCYVIAFAINSGDDFSIAFSVLFGWLLGVVWPAVVTVSTMLWLFF